ncbi:ROK family transcriptional regulator [Agromyces archimandritae]|uniref:ROK family transcriptional regulator n=1 Tax=Agromyces archimandritae TaxID=2781962 RepID=A0A975FLZ8_9MICO|nr:ROK family transcriptional regulator [Agromyces archimandritae]QTX03928.1 ROK family transcriptional regulator [Agromyces archimandritae]
MDASDQAETPVLDAGAATTGLRVTLGRELRPTRKVLPEHARSHNRALVLQTLFTAGPRSRADLARETGLTRVTVSDLVADLVGEGLVVELGQRESAGPGKPATLIDVDRAGFHIIAVDLSEHAVFRGAVSDLDGTIVARDEVALDGATGQAAIDRAFALIGGLLALTSTPVLGIGIGSPGVVDPNGVVRAAPNLGWTDLPLRDLAAAEFGLPAHVGNDANVAVLAEHRGAQTDDLMLVKVGHGVGAGVLLGGRLVLGSAFAAGEIGHVVVGDDAGYPCACGKTGCLESWLSAPRLSTRIAGLDEAGRELVLAEAGRRLGVVLAPVVGALNLPELVLSGPVDLLDGPLLDAAVETLRNRTMAQLTGDLRLRLTSHGQDIVLQGAAVMVLSGQLGVS